MKTVPDNYVYILDTLMSNFDHEIDYEVAERLKNEKVYADYPAWNFHGTVWFDDGKFYAKIMQYCSHIDTVEADTVQELMDKCSAKYGSD